MSRFGTPVNAIPAGPGWIAVYQNTRGERYYAPVAAWAVTIGDDVGDEPTVDLYGQDAHDELIDFCERDTDFQRYEFCRACFKDGLCDKHEGVAA